MLVFGLDKFKFFLAKLLYRLKKSFNMILSKLDPKKKMSHILSATSVGLNNFNNIYVFYLASL